MIHYVKTICQVKCLIKKRNYAKKSEKTRILPKKRERHGNRVIISRGNSREALSTMGKRRYRLLENNPLLDPWGSNVGKDSM